jgi:hypothetical protein
LSVIPGKLAIASATRNPGEAEVLGFPPLRKWRTLFADYVKI